MKTGNASLPDKWILDTVLGYEIVFDNIPQQNRTKPKVRFSDAETELVTEEILKLEKKNLIKSIEAKMILSRTFFFDQKRMIQIDLFSM
jgi:hypothetical protein